MRTRYKILPAVTVSMIIVSLLLPIGSAQAWEQPTHSQINLEAGRVFLQRYAFSGMEKYRMGQFYQQGFQEQYRGIAVESKSLLIDPWRGFDKYRIGERSLTLGQWVFYGGDWADEPHLYASVRHFYDPWSLWGQPYLTDHYEFHGWYDDPQVDARTWGLEHPDNPFSFQNGLRYYKAAMEVPESGEPPARLPLPDHFKLNVDLVPRDRADERGMYLALAYRALGESMHMLGDMTQPAHVRNDAHAIDEPIEKAVKRATVRDVANNPVVDAHIARFLGSAGGELQAPADLFRHVAIFTNYHFYSADTIYDPEEGVMPQNIDLVGSTLGNKHPYQSPQFKDLIVEEVTVEGWLGDRTTKKLYAPLINDRIPLAQERLSFHWFEPDMDVRERVARAANLAPYHIPSSFARDQARVLIPVAIYACADLMHHFFPTLELTAEYNDLGVVSEEMGGREEYSRQVIEIDTHMAHRQSEDAAWSDYGLSIDYSGPAELVFARGNEILKTRKLRFVDGELETIEDHEGRMVEEPLRIFIAEPGISLTEDEDFYRVERVGGSRIYLQIQAGSRTFHSPVLELDEEVEVEVSIHPPRDLILELAEGATEAEHNFEAVASPEGVYRFDWDFDDGETWSEMRQPGECSEVSHTYVGLQGDEVFHPSVRLYDQQGELLAEDQISVEVGATAQWRRMVVRVPPGSKWEDLRLETNVGDPYGVEGQMYVHDHSATPTADLGISFFGTFNERDYELRQQIWGWGDAQELAAWAEEWGPDATFSSGDAVLGTFTGEYATVTRFEQDDHYQSHLWIYRGTLASGNARFLLHANVQVNGEPGASTEGRFRQAVEEAQSAMDALHVELTR